MSSDFEQIDVQKAKDIIDGGQATIVDIRTQNFYDEAHIENALWVSGQNIEQFVKETDKNKPLICYCYKGFSSQDAARYFNQQAFKKVYNLIGGFDAWRETYPFVSGK